MSHRNQIKNREDKNCIIKMPQENIKIELVSYNKMDPPRLLR